MIELSEDEWRCAFPIWLRTGKLPSPQKDDAIECKFNPWHDPEDGRFTFAGSGNYHGANAFQRASHAQGTSGRRNTRDTQPAGAHKSKMRRTEKPNPAVEFVSGVGEGVSDVAKGAIASAHSMLTTNPVTTVRNAGLGIASMIDTAIAAEGTPARVQVSRVADTAANASARDIGRVTGSIAGNVALAVAPGAALNKVSALRRLRTAAPLATYEPPQVGWVKENLGPDKAWKQ